MADIEVTQVACNTSNGTQDITISGFGTPKAAMFILSVASSNGSENAPGVLSIGFTDGTNEHCISVHSEDNKASSNTARRSENACVSFDETWADDNRAIFDSWITNGVRIDWTKAPGTAWKLTVVLFGGDIQNAKVDSLQLTNSKDNAHNVTTVGFEPDFVISGSIGQSSQETLASNAHLRLGLSANLATDENRGLTWFDDDNEPAGEPHIYVSDTLCGVQPSWSWTAWAIDNYDSSGFDITPKNGDGGSIYVFYLAIQGASGCMAETFAENTPTGTGDDAHTSLSDQPEFLMTFWSYADAYGSLMDSGAECETVGISVADETNEYYVGYSCDEGADPTDCNSICDDNINAINPTRSNFIGTHKSFDASGWTWNFTSVDTTEAHKVVGFAYKGADTGVSGTFSSNLPLPTMNATGISSTTITGTFSSNIPLLTMSATGIAKTSGTFSSDLPLLTINATGTAKHVGTFSSNIPLPTMSATGIAKTSGTFSSDLPLPTINATGITSTAISGTFSSNLPLLTMNATGIVETTGVFASTIPLPTMSATGIAKTSGTFSSDLPLPTMSATGISSTTITGTFSSNIPLPTMSATGIAKTSGTFSSDIPLPTMVVRGIVAQTSSQSLFGIIETVTPAITGNHEFKVPGFGIVKGAIVLSSYVGSGYEGSYSKGFTDGTNEGVLAQGTQDAGTECEAIGYFNTDAIVVGLENSTFQYKGDVSALITDGIRINFSTADQGNKLRIILIGGSLASDISIEVDKKDNNVGNITDVGFEPDLVLAVANGEATNASVQTGSGYFTGSGFGASDGTNQYFVCAGSSDSLTTQGYGARNDASIGQIQHSTAWDFYSTISSFDSQGFTLSRTSGNAADVLYMAVKLPHKVKVQSVTTPTSTGNQNHTGFGFDPKVVLMGCSEAETINSVTSNSTEDDNPASMLGYYDGTNQETIKMQQGGEGGAYSYRSTFESNLVNTYQVTGNGNAFITDGVQINYIAVDTSNARQAFIVGFSGNDYKYGTFSSNTPLPIMDATGYVNLAIGIFASNIPLPTMNATGIVKHVGTFASNIPLPTMNATGIAKTVGTFSSNLPLPTMNATGIAKTVGTFSSNLPLPTMNVTGIVETTGIFASTIPLPTISATGIAKHVGTFTSNIPLPTISATGISSTAITGTFISNILLPIMSATGTTKITGTFTSNIPLPTISATGISSTAITGTFISNILLPTMSATGTTKITGTFTSNIPLPTISATGISSTAITGTFISNILLPTMDVTGYVGAQVFGTFTSNTPLPTMSATGIAKTTGTFTSNILLPTMSATGIVKTVGIFSSDISLPTMSATGIAISTISGTFSSDFPLPTMSATGISSTTISGMFSSNILLPTMSVTGIVGAQVSGIFASNIPLLTMSATGITSTLIIGTFNGHAPLLTMNATGIVKLIGTFASNIPLPTMSVTGTATSGSKTGTFASNIPLPTMSVTGTATSGSKTGTFTSNIPLPTISATGITSSIFGTFSSNIPLPIMNVTGISSTSIFGTFVSNLPLLTMNATGIVVKVIGTFSTNIPVPIIASLGRIDIRNISSVSFTIPILTLSATGSIKNAGVFSSNIPIPTMTASGITSTLITGTYSINVPLPVISSYGVVTFTEYDTIHEKLRARIAEAHKFMSELVEDYHTCTVYKNGETQIPIPGATNLSVIVRDTNRNEDSIFNVSSDIGTKLIVEIANQNGWEESDLHPQNYWLKLNDGFYKIRDVEYEDPISIDGMLRPSVAIVSCSRVKRAHGQGTIK